MEECNIERVWESVESECVIFGFHRIYNFMNFLDKSCLNDFGYSEEFCENLLDHDAENTEVQNAVAQFSVYESIVDHLIPILFSFFLGSWSDNFGRKYLLYLFFFFCLVNTSKFTDYKSFSNHC